MNDLISRKALLKDIKKYVAGTPLQEMFETIIDNQPTAYDVNKVVEQLENACCTDIDGVEFPIIDADTAIEIVKGGGKDE